MSSLADSSLVESVSSAEGVDVPDGDVGVGVGVGLSPPPPPPHAGVMRITPAIMAEPNSLFV